MIKTTTILGFSIVLALIIGIASSGTIIEAAKPLAEIIIANPEPIPVIVDNFPTSESSPICPTENVQHWNKIVFHSLTENDLLSLVHPTLPDLNPFVNATTEFVIQVEPNQLTDVNQLMADKLNEIGYQAEKLDGSLSSVKDGNIFLTDVEYSIICAEN